MEWGAENGYGRSVEWSSIAWIAKLGFNGLVQERECLTCVVLLSWYAIRTGDFLLNLEHSSTNRWWKRLLLRSVYLGDIWLASKTGDLFVLDIRGRWLVENYCWDMQQIVVSREVSFAPDERGFSIKFGPVSISVESVIANVIEVQFADKDP